MNEDAALEGCIDELKLLLENGSDVNIKTNMGMSPLPGATGCGCLQPVWGVPTLAAVAEPQTARLNQCYQSTKSYYQCHRPTRPAEVECVFGSFRSPLKRLRRTDKRFALYRCHSAK